MSQRLLINCILLLAVLVSGLFLYFSGDGETSSEDVVLTGLQPTDITAIILLRKNSDNIRFTRQENRWHMQSPYNLPANQARINTLFGLLSAHSYTQLQRDNLDLHRFALEEPAVSVRFDNTQIDFGDTSPIGKQRYVRVGDTVHLINDSLFQQLQTPATFFLDSRLLPAEAEINAIHFPDSTLQWQDEQWQLSATGNVSADNMAKVVNAWQQAQAVSVREYEEAEAHGTITVELQEGKPLQFAIVNLAPQLVLARTDIGLQYHLSSYDAERLFLEEEEQETDSISPPPSPLQGEGE